jgi:hypothetical protein
MRSDEMRVTGLAADAFGAAPSKLRLETKRSCLRARQPTPPAPAVEHSLEHHRHVLRVDPVEEQPVGAARRGGGRNAPEVAEEADDQLLGHLLLQRLAGGVRLGLGWVRLVGLVLGLVVNTGV